MTNLQLVESCPRTGEHKLKAVSTSYSALVEYCKEKFDADVVDPTGDESDIYYTIDNCSVIIVPAKQ